MKIFQSNYIYAIIYGVLILLIPVSCDSCGNANAGDQTGDEQTGGEQAKKLTLSVNKKLLVGNDVNFVVSLSNKNSQEADLSKFTLKATVTEAGSSLAYTDAQGNAKFNNNIDESLTHFTPQQLLKSGDNPLKLSFKIQPHGGTKTVNIKLGLYYQGQGQALIEETILWKEKSEEEEVELALLVNTTYLRGNQANDKQITFMVVQTKRSVSPDKKIVLQLTPHAGTTATIAGATQEIDASSNKIVYTFQIQPNMLLNDITDLSINPNGSDQARFKLQLLYGGKSMGNGEDVTWESGKGVQLTLRVTKQDLQGNDAKDRQIEFTVTSVGSTLPNDTDEIVLRLTPEAGTTALITGATLAIDASGKPFYNFKIPKDTLGNPITALSIDPLGSNQDQAKFKLQLFYNDNPMGQEQPINWEAAAATSPKVADIQAMIDTAYKQDFKQLESVLNLLQYKEDAKNIVKLDNRILNKVGPGSFTALQEAIKLGRADIVQLLLGHGVDVNTQNQTVQAKGLMQKTAMQLALSMDNRNWDIIRLLLENKADVNTQTASGQTAIQLAVIDLNLEMIQFLFENNSVNKKITDSDTNRLLLTLALERYDKAKNTLNITPETFKKITDLLINELNADDINQIDPINNKTILAYALSCNEPEIAQELRKKGAAEGGTI